MKLGLIITAVLLLLVGGAVVGCTGTQVKSGYVGVRVVDIGGDAGVQDQELTTRWYAWRPGSYVLQFPTTTQTEVWSNAEHENRVGPAFSFRNRDGVLTTVAISAQVHMDPTKASNAVQRYRLGFQEIIRGPVQRDLQDAFVRAGIHYGSDQLMREGASALLAEVHETVSARLLNEGVVFDSINMVGAPGLPDEIINRINQRIEAEQNAATQEQQVRVVEAQARQAIAEAAGRAEALAIEGRAIRDNPEVLRLRALENWSGQCPLDADTCVLGASALVDTQ